MSSTPLRETVVVAPSRPDRWGVVVPVKSLDVAKSRLAGFGDHGRRGLALAFAQDVVRAAVACPLVRQVLVITDDDDAGRELALLGADIRPDLPAAGLNPALEHGAALLREGLGVAALSSDLPALKAADLGATLAGAARRFFVADADGRGTTLLAAAAGAPLLAAYGPGSAQLHRSSGAQEVAGAPGLRRDVDTPDDLAAAVTLGVGPSTAAVLVGLGQDAVRLAGARSPGQGTMPL